MYVTVGSPSESAYVCLYNSIGSASNTAVTGSATQYTAGPGTYLVGFEQSGAGGTATFTGNAAVAGLIGMLNKTGAASGTVCGGGLVAI